MTEDPLGRSHTYIKINIPVLEVDGMMQMIDDRLGLAFYPGKNHMQNFKEMKLIRMPRNN
jgi:hypothetical protein